MFFLSTKKSIAIAIAALALISCESEKQPAMFYAIDSLVTSQIEYLTSVRAELYKEASLGDETDTTTYVPDEVTWKKELDIFEKLNDINKPVNKTHYAISEGVDTGSNLTVRSFKSLKDLPIEYLKVYYQADIKKLRKIEALYEEENALFHSQRHVSMRFQQVGNRTVLTSYSIEGGQKMTMGDSVAFIINGKVFVDKKSRADRNVDPLDDE